MFTEKWLFDAADGIVKQKQYHRLFVLNLLWHDKSNCSQRQTHFFFFLLVKQWVNQKRKNKKNHYPAYTFIFLVLSMYYIVIGGRGQTSELVVNKNYNN